MPQKPPKMPGKEVVARIHKQIAKQDRVPFTGLLAEAIAVAPSKTAMRSLARQDPRKYVSMIKDLAELSGYAQRTESIQIRHDARSMALELVNRVGPDRAKEILADFGLPSSLVPNKPEPVDEQ